MILKINEYIPFIKEVNEYNLAAWRDEETLQDACLSIYKKVDSFIFDKEIEFEKPSIQTICSFILKNEKNIEGCISDPYKRQELTKLANRITKEFPNYSKASITSATINHYANAKCLSNNDLLLNILSFLSELHESNDLKVFHLKNTFSVSKTFYKCATLLKRV